MKTLFIFIVLFFTSTISYSQCFENGINFNSQQEIDEFILNNASCNKIGGNVTIQDTVGNDIINLDGLSNIDSIMGNLFIGNNEGLNNLTGLNNLKHIDSILWIEQNNNLTSLSALSNLSEIGTDLTITNNQSLSSLVGLEGITTVKNLYIGIDNSLENLQGLNNITTIIGECLIEYNPALQNLNGLGSLQTSGLFNIFNNDNLTSFDGISALETITDDLSIGGNESLTDITALGSVSTVNGDLWIGYNTSLPSLAGLDKISTVGGGVWIGGDTLLADLSGLKITDIGDFLQIEYNKSLKHLTGLENLNSVGSFVWIGFNDSLITLEALGNLSTIGGDLSIGDCDTLFTLTGLEGLTSLNGSLYVGSNYWLQSFAGLENINSINGYLSMSYNTNLTDISAIANIDANGIKSADTTPEDLEIYFCDSLETCHIKSICDFMELNDKTKNIHDNKTGCNTEEEIETLCATVPIRWGIPLFAQPENDKIILSGSVLQQENTDRFIIENSNNGIDFIAIAEVRAEGDLDIEKQYQYTDKNPYWGNNYYRIKVIDFDGEFTYSNIAHATNTITPIQCYPNPVMNQLMINSSTDSEIDIYSTIGKNILHTVINKGTNIISTSDWNVGIYYLKDHQGNKLKIIKQ